MADAYPPDRVIPASLAEAVDEIDYWFVIGGNAVRCFSPYRPTHDVDFGVPAPSNLDDLLEHLERTGDVELLERKDDTAHLRWNGVNVSVFVLDRLVSFTEERRLNTTGILATKLHAILDRGMRRDFFDLYVTLQHHQLGIASCLEAMRTVYAERVGEPLLLRALTYFDDAEREAKLPGEGDKDWKLVKSFFLERVGALLVPPSTKLAIQDNTVDVTPSG